MFSFGFTQLIGSHLTKHHALFICFGNAIAVYPFSIIRLEFYIKITCFYKAIPLFVLKLQKELNLLDKVPVIYNEKKLSNSFTENFIVLIYLIENNFNL